MFSNKLVLALVAAAALTAAAGAGVLIGARSASDDRPPEAAAPASGAVEATEAALDESAADAPRELAPAEEPPAAAKNEPAPSRATAPSAARPAARPPAERETPAPARTARTRRAPKPAPAPREATVERPEPAPVARPLPGTAPEEGVFARTTPPVAGVQTLPPLPPEPQFEELTVPANSVMGLRLLDSVSSETAQIEDRVEARVTRDILVDGRVVIPAGSRVIGSVSDVDPGGKLKERARLGVRFHTLVLADGTDVPIQTDTLYREGESPSNASAAKIGGGAIGGAILGGILGGGKGAAIGGAIGAAGGTTAVMAGRRRPAELYSGSTVTVKLLSPVSITVER